MEKNKNILTALEEFMKARGIEPALIREIIAILKENEKNGGGVLLEDIAQEMYITFLEKSRIKITRSYFGKPIRFTFRVLKDYDHDHYLQACRENFWFWKNKEIQEEKSIKNFNEHIIDENFLRSEPLRPGRYYEALLFQAIRPVPYDVQLEFLREQN